MLLYYFAQEITATIYNVPIKLLTFFIYFLWNSQNYYNLLFL